MRRLTLEELTGLSRAERCVRTVELIYGSRDVLRKLHEAPGEAATLYVELMIMLCEKALKEDK